MSEILARTGFAEQPPEETSRQARLYQQSSVEFGEKICKLKADGSRETEDRMFVVGSGASNAQC